MIRSRLRKAALWMLAATLGSLSARADDPSVANTVKLDLQVSGHAGEGFELEIKPSHAGSKFEPKKLRVEKTSAASPARLNTITLDATSTAADRDCSFTINVREPGRPARTYRRSVRLAAAEPGQPKPVVSMKCYLGAQAVGAKDAGKVTR